MDSPPSTSGPTTCTARRGLVRRVPGHRALLLPARTGRRPAYIEFRIGDAAGRARHHRPRYAPPGATAGPGRSDHALARRRPRGRRCSGCSSLGATEYEPITPRSDGLRHRVGGRPVRQRARASCTTRTTSRWSRPPGRRELVTLLEFRRRRRLGVLAGRAPRRRHRGVAADRQARLRASRRIVIADALDVALCYGWIDGQRKGLDDVLVPAALLPAATAQLVVADQRGQGRGADRRRPDATRRGSPRSRRRRRTAGGPPRTRPSARPRCHPTWRLALAANPAPPPRSRPSADPTGTR